MPLRRFLYEGQKEIIGEVFILSSKHNSAFETIEESFNNQLKDYAANIQSK